MGIPQLTCAIPLELNGIECAVVQQGWWYDDRFRRPTPPQLGWRDGHQIKTATDKLGPMVDMGGSGHNDCAGIQARRNPHGIIDRITCAFRRTDGVDPPISEMACVTLDVERVHWGIAASQFRAPGDVWEHFYGNTGEDYPLNTATLDAWTAETTHNYPDPDLKAPATVVEANKEDAIARAIAEADRTGQESKVLVSTEWNRVAGADADHVQSLGRYSLCSTTGVIAQPGPPGGHHIRLRQQTHIYDVYDFHSGDDYGDLAEQAVEVAVLGEKLGIAKPFLTLGSGSENNWTGVR